MHLLINLLWRCGLSCPYCLLPHIKINRDAQEHTWQEWTEALIDQTPPGSLYDFGGGDPLLFAGLARMVDVLARHGRHWAVTTSAVETSGVDELMHVRPHGCACFNISDHPGNYDASDNIRRLQSAFPVVFNRVDHPQAGHRHGDIHALIPYQTWRERGTDLDGIRRWCNSGIHHWVIDPGGDVFRCNPAMATAQTPLGNLFRRDIVIPEPCICETGCSTCYTGAPNGPAAWHVEMRPV